MLNFAGERSYISLKRSVKPKHWSQEFGRITKGANVRPSTPQVNDFITKQLADAQKVIDQATEQGILETLTHQELKTRILNGSVTPATFSSYLDSLISGFTSSGNHGQARIYNQARAFLKKYGDKESGIYRFDEINYRLLRLIEDKYVPRKPGSLNGLALNYRTLRAVWNRAMKEGLAPNEKYPFKQFTIKKSKTHKSAITQAELDKIASLDLPVGSRSWHARNLFLFSFHCRGMNFADIAVLKYSNIQAGRIEYVRKKTGKLISIKISQPIQHLFDLYQKNTAKPDDYIFPVVTTKANPDDQALNYLSMIDHSLKRWAAQLGIHDSLSFNTARHSWATIGKNMNLSVAVISQGLGHADIETTQIYLDEFDKSLMDEASEMISRGVKQPV